MRSILRPDGLRMTGTSCDFVRVRKEKLPRRRGGDCLSVFCCSSLSDPLKAVASCTASIGETAALTAICVIVDNRFGGFAGTGLDGTKSSDSSIDIEDIDATDIFPVCEKETKRSDLRSRSTGREARLSIRPPSLRLIARLVGTLARSDVEDASPHDKTLEDPHERRAEMQGRGGIGNGGGGVSKFLPCKPPEWCRRGRFGDHHEVRYLHFITHRNLW